MNTRAIYIIGILIAIFSLTMATATAAPTAIRDLPGDCVDPGDTFVVQITASGTGFTQVIETLCAGWTYMGSSLPDAQVDELAGNQVKFTLLSAETFTYTVQAPSTPGASCDIAGIVKDTTNTDGVAVGGESQVSVCSEQQPNGPSATRNLPDDCIDPEDTFVVQITASGTGFIQVIETLCAGWTYVDSSLPDTQVEELAGNQVKFTLLSAETFTYTVQAPSTPGASCIITGIVKDTTNTDGVAVGGESQVSVCNGQQPYGPSATRDLLDCIDPEDTFVVQITPSGTGFVQVIETLCNGWIYVDSSLPDTQVEELAGNQVKFTLLSAETFTYTVQAPSTPGVCCDISGIVKDTTNMVGVAIGGDSQVCICDEDSPRPRITDPSDGATVSGIITIVEEDLSGQDDIVYNLFEYRPVSGTTWTEIGNDTNGSDGWWVLWNTKAVVNGSYYIRVTMGDNESLTGSDQISVNVDNPPQYGISLESGWNLFSVPCVLDDDSRAHVLEGVDYEAIIWFDANSQQWKDNPATIEPLTAYAIQVNNTTQQVITNIECTDLPIVPPSRHMYPGWNLVGLTSYDTKTAESAFIAGGIDDSYSRVWGPWNAGDRELEQLVYNRNFLDPGAGYLYTEDYIMRPYKGQWIFMEQEDTLIAIGP
jgi:hypothetical protein